MVAGLLPSERDCEVFKPAELEGKRGLALPVRVTELNKLNTLCSGRSWIMCQTKQTGDIKPSWHPPVTKIQLTTDIRMTELDFIYFFRGLWDCNPMLLLLEVQHEAEGKPNICFHVSLRQYSTQPGQVCWVSPLQEVPSGFGERQKCFIFQYTDSYCSIKETRPKPSKVLCLTLSDFKDIQAQHISRA